MQAEGCALRKQKQLFQPANMVFLGTPVSGVAHGINNPITSVLLNAPNLGRICESIFLALRCDGSLRLASATGQPGNLLFLEQAFPEAGGTVRIQIHGRPKAKVGRKLQALFAVSILIQFGHRCLKMG